MAEPHKERGPLVVGALAALAASTCCLGPLILVGLGFSGAWIGNLTVLEPFRPLFIGAALIAMFFAWKRIHAPAKACDPENLCAAPRAKTAYKLIFWIVAALVSVALVYPFILPFFY